jgi:peptidoglycan/xylan/chitin deacetylase (PgdA/CDA1 family)
MRNAAVAYCLLASIIGLGPAAGAECPGNPGALGVSRTIVVDPTEHALLGALQYRESLPLNDKEIVLTFDDGPLQPYTTRVLDVLAAECVKATFFMVGRMARGYPHLVRRAYSEGHTIANHSQNHPFSFHKMTVDQAAHEIEDGFSSLRSALGESGKVADFFRIPGLLRQEPVEQYLTAHGVMTWSVDFLADDWTHIPAKEVVRRALNRIEARGRGILLLHDIQPATAAGLPDLLKELKARGYKIVHVVQAGPDRPKTASAPEQWVVQREPAGLCRASRSQAWYCPNRCSRHQPAKPRVTGRPGARVPAAPVPRAENLRTGDGGVPAMARWPRGVRLSALPETEVLPVPAAENFRYSRIWRQRAVVRVARKPAAPKDAAPAPSPKGVVPPAPVRATTTVKDLNQPAARTRPTGHQIQLPKPPAGLPG